MAFFGHFWAKNAVFFGDGGSETLNNLASSSTYTAVPEPMPRRYEDDYHRPAAAVYMTGISGYAASEPGYTMPAPGFTSRSGLRGPESCGGSS